MDALNQKLVGDEKFEMTTMLKHAIGKHVFIGLTQVGLGLHSNFDALDASPSEHSWPL